MSRTMSRSRKLVNYYENSTSGGEELDDDDNEDVIHSDSKNNKSRRTTRYTATQDNNNHQTRQVGKYSLRTRKPKRPPSPPATQQERKRKFTQSRYSLRSASSHSSSLRNVKPRLYLEQQQNEEESSIDSVIVKEQENRRFNINLRETLKQRKRYVLDREEEEEEEEEEQDREMYDYEEEDEDGNEGERNHSFAVSDANYEGEDDRHEEAYTTDELDHHQFDEEAEEEDDEGLKDQDIRLPCIKLSKSSEGEFEIVNKDEVDQFLTDQAFEDADESIEIDSEEERHSEKGDGNESSNEIVTRSRNQRAGRSNASLQEEPEDVDKSGDDEFQPAAVSTEEEDELSDVVIESSDEEAVGSRYFLRRRRMKKKVSEKPLRSTRRGRYVLRDRRRSSFAPLAQDDEIALEPRLDKPRSRRRPRAALTGDIPRRTKQIEGDQLLPINWSEFRDQDADSDDQVKDTSKLLADITPVAVDKRIDWNEVGGLDSHIRSLKEMVILPLLYPDFFDRFNIQPPRGVLFYGPPGTGKTLTARALASCCSQTGQKVSFFMRKGADVLSKWVGESERQLRLLFEEASKVQPSIIFFDEIDGLAPVRSSRQDQIHSSIVSTLLALMDGLNSRGQVIVIGATNRIDAIDPALRRPGRFDRELGFDLPTTEGRKTILKIHTKAWSSSPSEQQLLRLSSRTSGFCGADLRALCTEASLNAVKRCFPQIYDSTVRLDVNMNEVKVFDEDFDKALLKIVPTSVKTAPGVVGREFPEHMGVLLQDSIQCFAESDMYSTFRDLKLLQHHGPVYLKTSVVITESRFGGQAHLVQGLLGLFEDFPISSISLAQLYLDPFSRSIEESCAKLLEQAGKSSPSVLHWPNLDLWWETASEQMKAIVLSFVKSCHGIFILMSVQDIAILPEDVRQILSHLDSHVFTIEDISIARRITFFESLVLEIQSASTVQNPPDNVVSSGQHCESTVQIARIVTEKKIVEKCETSHADDDVDERLLLKMRIRLRSLCTRLMSDFKVLKDTPSDDLLQEFGLPSFELVAQPIHLIDILSKVNSRDCCTVEDFLALIDQLVTQTHEFYCYSNSFCSSMINQACQLQDIVLSAVYTFPKDLVRRCQEIIKMRISPKSSLENAKSDVTEERTRHIDRSKDDVSVMPSVTSAGDEGVKDSTSPTRNGAQELTLGHGENGAEKEQMDVDSQSDILEKLPLSSELDHKEESAETIEVVEDAIEKAYPSEVVSTDMVDASEGDADITELKESRESEAATESWHSQISSILKNSFVTLSERTDRIEDLLSLYSNARLAIHKFCKEQGLQVGEVDKLHELCKILESL